MIDDIQTFAKVYFLFLTQKPLGFAIKHNIFTRTGLFCSLSNIVDECISEGLIIQNDSSYLLLTKKGEEFLEDIDENQIFQKAEDFQLNTSFMKQFISINPK